MHRLIASSPHLIIPSSDTYSTNPTSLLLASDDDFEKRISNRELLLYDSRSERLFDPAQETVGQ
jgi:hypothetical protein